MSELINDESIDLKECLDIWLRRWKTWLLVALVITLGAFIYNYRQKSIYETKATILLRSGGNNSMSQYSGIAGMLGINLGGGGSNLGDLIELLRSKAVAAKVLDDLKLIKRIKGWDDPKIRRSDLASAVSGMLKSPKLNGNIIEIKAESDDPQLAADVANGFIAALSYYWNELNYTEAQKKLKYIQAELPRVKADLNVVEEKMKLVPRTATGFSISGQGGLQRDYEIYNSVYTMLRKEMESTKLEASKEIPPFSLIDAAEKPIVPIRPRRKYNTIIGAILGLFCGTAIAFFQEYWEKTKITS